MLILLLYTSLLTCLGRLQKFNCRRRTARPNRSASPELQSIGLLGSNGAGKTDYGDPCQLTIKLKEDLGNNEIHRLNLILKEMRFCTDERKESIVTGRNKLVEDEIKKIEEILKEYNLKWKNKTRDGQLLEYQFDKQNICMPAVNYEVSLIKDTLAYMIEDCWVTEVTSTN